MTTILKRVLFVCILATLFCTMAFAGFAELPSIAPADDYYLISETHGHHDESTNTIIIEPLEIRYDYKFDKNGNLIKKNILDLYNNEIVSESETIFTYDENFNLVKETYSINGFTSVTMYVYDEHGRLSLSRTENNQRAVDTVYTYDSQDRLIRKTVGNNYCFTYNYDAQGNCIQEEQFYLNGQQQSKLITYEYDNDYCTAYHQEMYDGDNISVTYDIEFKYDAYGNNTEMIVYTGSKNGVSGCDFYYYEYEKIGGKKENAENTVKNPFSDVSDDAWYTDAVLWAASEGITVGTGDGQFKPDDICDRGQVMTFLHRAVDTPAPTIKNVPFTDVKSGMWYTDAILWSYEAEISNGVNAEGTLFGLTDKMTRSQIVTLLYRLAGSPDVSGTELPFGDIKADTWYTNAVIWAVQEGITTGTDKGFEPDRPLTRAETVTFLNRYINK